MDTPRPCPDAALLAAFIDGTLTGDERLAVVAHLAECPDCRAVTLTVVEFREVQALDHLWHAGSSLPPVPAVDHQAASEAPAARGPLRALAFAAGLSLAVLTAAAAIWPGWRAHQDGAPAGLADGRALEARLSGAPVPAPASALLRVRTVLPRTPRDAATARALGMAAIGAGRLDEAVANLALALATAPDAGVAIDLAAAHYERARRAGRADDLPAALDAAERAVTLDPARPEGWFNRALAISALGLRTQARAAWHAYLARESESGFAVEARARLAALPSSAAVEDWIDQRRGLLAGTAAAQTIVEHHHARTRQWFDAELLAQLVAAHHDDDRARQNELVGQMQAVAAAFEQYAGDRSFRATLQSLDEAGRRDAKGEWIAAHEAFLAVMAVVARGRFADAAAPLTRAAARLDAVGSPYALRARLEAAAADYYAGLFDATIAITHDVRRQAVARGFLLLEGRAAWLAGLAAFGQQDFATAQREYEAMRRIAEATFDVDAGVTASVLLANLHWMAGDAAAAWHHRVQAAGDLDRVQNATTRANFFLSAAGDALAGDHAGAALLFETALIESGPGLSPNAEVQARAQRARTWHRLRRMHEAHADLEAARQRLAAVEDLEARSRVDADVLAAEAEVWLASDPATAMVSAERALTLPVTAREPLRRARVSLLLAEAAIAAGRLDVADRAVSRGLDAFERFRALPSARFALGASEQAWGLYVKAMELALRRGDLTAAFGYGDRRREETTSPPGRPAPLPSLATVQQALAADTALVVLTQMREHLLVWVVRRDQVAHQQVALDAGRAAALVATHLTELHAGAVPAVSADLYDLTFAPVKAALAGARALMVIADRPYHRVAFAALWDRARARYLVEDHALTVVPSAARLLRAGGSASSLPAPRRAAYVAGPARETAPVPGAMAAGVVGIYGGDRAGARDAMSAARTLEDLTGHDVLHIAAPITGSDEFPAFARIVVEADVAARYFGAVTADRLVSRAAGARLVALDARSPEPADAATHGPWALAGNLSSAGVTVVMTPIAVDDNAALDRTWLAFHRHFAGGAGAADSVRQAQLDALAVGGRRLGPWATLTVFSPAR